uniref:DUF5641 domain-containing protein n=1 Tax=Haemonchus placei TaxID=6290 RepID=A0A0N4W9U2_HAEPC
LHRAEKKVAKKHLASGLRGDKTAWFWKGKAQRFVEQKMNEYKGWQKMRFPEDPAVHRICKRLANITIAKAKSTERQGEKFIFRLVKAWYRVTDQGRVVYLPWNFEWRPILIDRILNAIYVHIWELKLQNCSHKKVKLLECDFKCLCGIVVVVSLRRQKVRGCSQGGQDLCIVFSFKWRLPKPFPTFVRTNTLFLPLFALVARIQVRMDLHVDCMTLIT